MITNQPLYQLSYIGIPRRHSDAVISIVEYNTVSLFRQSFFTFGPKDEIRTTTRKSVFIVILEGLWYDVFGKKCEFFLKGSIEKMDKLLPLEFSLFVMIALGFILRKWKILSEKAMKDITNLVLYVVLPCQIFKSFIGKDLSSLAADCLMVLLISIGVQVLAVVYGKLAFPKQGPEHRVNLAYGMICSNAGFLGNAIAESLFGATGLMLASIYLIPMRIMMWSEGLALYSGVNDVKKSIVKVATHPCVIACMLGIVCMIFGVQVPTLLMTPISSLGSCTTPLSMMVIGFVLSQIDLKHLVDKTILWFTLHRLVAAPALVWVVCKVLAVSPLATGICVILAAMPAGATTTMLAAKYERDPEFATKMVIFSTLCSIPAIFVWSLLLKV